VIRSPRRDLLTFGAILRPILDGLAPVAEDRCDLVPAANRQSGIMKNRRYGAALEMGKKAPVDKQLATMLKAAMKKRMHFVAVVKSPAEGKLFVSKTKVDKDSVAEAKETLGGGRSFKGQCQGKNGKLVFMVNKEPPATLGPVLQRYAKVYAGLKIKAEAVFAAELVDDAKLAGKSQASLDRRAATAAINEALVGQDEDIHRKRKFLPTTKDKNYQKNVTAPANAALSKASEELMTSDRLSDGTVKELQNVLATLAAARVEYQSKIKSGSEQDQQRQKKVLAIAKREEAIRKVLAQAASGGKPAAKKSAPSVSKSGSEEENSESESAEDTSTYDEKSVNQSLKSVSKLIAKVSDDLPAPERKKLQQSLKRVQTLRDSQSFGDAMQALNDIRDSLAGSQIVTDPSVKYIGGKGEEEESETSELSEDDVSEDLTEDVSEDESEEMSEPTAQQRRKSFDALRDDEGEARSGGAGNYDNLDSLRGERTADVAAEDGDDKQEEEDEDIPTAPPIRPTGEQPKPDKIPPAPGPMKMRANPQILRGAADQWKKSMKAIDKQVNSLQGALLRISDDRSPKIARGLNRVRTGIPDLSGILGSLAEAKDAKDEEAATQLVAQAKRLLDATENYANTNGLVEHLDSNPFVKLQVKKILVDTVNHVRNLLK